MFETIADTDSSHSQLNEYSETNFSPARNITTQGLEKLCRPTFSVNVGTVVPRGHIHLVRVPGSLVRIEPRWRHFLYFVYNNEIVIVNPRTMRIVNVMPV